MLVQTEVVTLIFPFKAQPSKNMETKILQLLEVKYFRLMGYVYLTLSNEKKIAYLSVSNIVFKQKISHVVN